MTSDDRLKLILEDIASMIESYKMEHGEISAIFMAFAAKDALLGGMDHETFMEWARTAWTSETFKELQKTMREATVTKVQNNGIFKS